MKFALSAHTTLGAIAASILLSVPLAGFAGETAKGQNEMAGSLTYTNLDSGFIETTETQVDLSYGRYLTDSHEVGARVTYYETEIEEEGFGSESIDGMGFGVFYHFNFVTSSVVTPFLGANVSWLGGDVGDVYDFQYGIEGGIKVYPFEHAGVVIGLEWAQLQAAENYYDDADGLSFAVGLLIRF